MDQSDRTQHAAAWARALRADGLHENYQAEVSVNPSRLQLQGTHLHVLFAEGASLMVSLGVVIELKELNEVELDIEICVQAESTQYLAWCSHQCVRTL